MVWESSARSGPIHLILCSGYSKWMVEDSIGENERVIARETFGLRRRVVGMEVQTTITKGVAKHVLLDRIPFS